jgi:5'-nucleotidase
MRPAAVLLSIGALAACKKPPVAPAPEKSAVTIPIAALNDFHGGLYESILKSSSEGQQGTAFGGLPILAAAIDSLRAEHPDLLLLDGGDEFQGSWPVNATNGLGSVEAFELLGVDAAAVGNHEFDYGGLPGGHPLRGAIEAAAASADYPLLSANIYEKDGTRWDPPNVLPWTVIERQGVRLAIVGLTTRDTPTTTDPTNVADLEFRDVVQSVEQLLPEIEAADVDARILVAHLLGSCKPAAYVRNDDPCTPDGEIGELLTKLPPGTFDVMVLGHTHTVLHHRVGDTFLLESRSGGHLIGRLDLVVGPDGVDPDASIIYEPWALSHAPIDPGCEDRAYPTEPLEVGGKTLTPKREAVDLVDRLEQEAGSLCDELACNKRALYRDRAQETELGNLLADAMLATFPQAQLAVQNSGGIRADLPDGVVRREHLQRVMPFENRTVLVQMTGAQLRLLLRIGTSGAHGIVQLAGGRIVVDRARQDGQDLDKDGEIADWERDHLCSATVGGAPLEDERKYLVATSDFLYNGGDHLGPAFAGAEIVAQGPLLRDALYRYAERFEGCIGDKPLIDAAAPRIVMDRCP